MIGSATTWQATTTCGAGSRCMAAAGELVKRSYAVSLDRPYDKKGRSLLYAFEIPLVRVAEESGVPLAWMTNIDITLNPNLLDGAVAAVSGGHDEVLVDPVPRRTHSIARRRGQPRVLRCEWLLLAGADPDSVPTPTSSSLVTNRPHWTR